MHFKKKKIRKQRGSTYHGYGRGQSHHKGAGNRGGRGRAGTGKRADQKKPSYWKEPTGRRGFASKSRKRINAINLEEIYANLNIWLKKGFAGKNQAGYAIDLKKAGYDKLLGTGEVKEKLFITTDFASKGAVEKIKAAGGEVKILKTIFKKEKKKAEKPKKKEKKEEKEETEEEGEEVSAEKDEAEE
jgi:large subunit ribosomal protein L15